MSVNENSDYFVPLNRTMVKNLAATAARIAYSHFQWRYITLVFFNTTVLVAEDFLQLYDKSAVVSTGKTKPYYAENTDQYVISGKDIQDINTMLDWMTNQTFDNTGRYIVICESHREQCNESEAVNTFWYHKITNVIFLRYSENKVHAYTYFFNGDNCAMSTPYEMPNFELCIENITKCQMYPEKFNDLHGCPLIASTFEQHPYMTLRQGYPQGCDGDLLAILAEALNSTLKVITPQQGDGWGSLDPNGTWLGSLGDVYYDYANISMTSAALTLNRFSHFHLSFNYNFVSIGWVTCPTLLEPSSLKLIYPFRKATHIAVDVAFVSVIVFTMITRTNFFTKFIRRPDANSQTVVFLSWMICMGIPSLRLPKKSFFLYMTFLWIWYTFLVRTMYQASLINSLKSNIYKPNVDTVEDAIASNYMIGGGHALKDYFINYPLVYERYIGMNASLLATTVYRISRGEKSLMAVNLESVNTFVKEHGGALHIVAQRILISPTAIFFKKFSPLTVRIDTILRRLFEAGIPDKLYRIHVKPPTKMPKKNDNNEPLRTEHYKGCYLILTVGWAVSVTVFIFEFCIGIRSKLYTV